VDYAEGMIFLAKKLFLAALGSYYREIHGVEKRYQ